MVLHGTMAGGEIWETGFWMSDTGVTDASLANALAQLLAQTLNANDESGALAQMALEFWTGAITWTEVRVYGYPNGGTKAAFVGLYELPSGVTGTGTTTLPNQVCLVLTLNTGLAGRSHRGRMYIPIAKATLDASSELTSQLLTDFVTTWRTFFSDVNASDAGEIVVVSQSLGAFSPLSSVKADSRLDIQRRRANQQSIRQVVSQAVTAHPA